MTVPALVMHGDCDTLIDQSGGRRTAELIPGARFELIEGMGHDYPPSCGSAGSTSSLLTRRRNPPAVSHG